MRNKKFVLSVISIIIVFSQFNIGVTVLATTEIKNDINTENISEEQLETTAEIIVDDQSKAYGPETRGTSMSIDTPNPLWVSLGSTEKDFSNAIYDQGNIRIDGKETKWDDIYFSTQIISGNTDIISGNSNSSGTYFSTVHDSSNNVANYQTVSSTYKVNYGNSIVFGTKYNMLGAFTHHVRQNGRYSSDYVITASNGMTNNDGIINGNYIGEDYYIIEYFSKFGDWSRPSKSVVAKGDDKKADVLRRWGTTNVSNGGVIRTWSADKKDNNLFVSNGSNTQEKNHANKEGYAYYKITENGFEPFQVTPLKVVPQTINIHTTDEQLDNMLNDLFDEIPNGVTVDKFTEYPKRDNEGKSKGKVQVTENSNVTQNKDVVQVYEIPFDVTEVYLEVELKENIIPVGTPISEISLDDYVKKVTLGDRLLDQSEYIVSFVKEPSTTKVNQIETVINIVTKEGNKSVTEKTKTSIIWGDSLGSSKDGTDKTPMDVSVSMLHDGKNPYLVANEGNGLAGDASSLSNIYVYRGSEDKAGEVFYSRHYYPKGQARETMDLWNNGGTWFNGTTQLKGFKDTEFHYGDVVAYEAVDDQKPGSKTWTSREEKLIKESVGYKKAYYEMTKDGFNLLQLNRLEVNKNIPVVSMNTSIEDMNKKAHESMVIPTGNTGEYIFEYASVDTKTSGKKKTKLNVYETLATGGKFMTTYEVEYMVNPQVTEKYVTEKDEVLKSPVLTSFDFGTEYQVSPENFITVDGDVYIYQGWLDGSQTAGKDTPKKETPKAVKEVTTFQYIYKKADNMIDMTIPTELLFETDKENKQVSSKNYEIKNNSTEVSTEVILEEFVKKKSDVKLLNSRDNNPTKETKAARLNLIENNKVVIDSLTEATNNQTIRTLKAGETTTIGLTGTYFGSMEESNYVNYHMNFKFKAGVK